MSKILIIGENTRNREFLAEELAAEGHGVVSIGNPSLIDEVLAGLEPDLVLLGFHINGMDRWEASNVIHRLAPHLPVLSFISCGIGKKEIRLVSRDGYEIKTFPLEILKQKIAALLGSKPFQAYKPVANPYERKEGRA